MDTFLTNQKGFDFYLISKDSTWWAYIIESGQRYDKEFVPALSARMPIVEYFARFRTDDGFTVIATNNDEFAGCLCNFFKHPETNKPWYQCIIIEEKYRQNKLARIFYDLSDEILGARNEIFVQGRTWTENIRNRKALKSIGFYQIETKVNDRGEGIHTLLYEKSLYQSEYFKNINFLGLLGGMGSNTSAKFHSDICFLSSQTEKEQDQLPILHYSATKTPDRTELLLNNQQSVLCELLTKQITELVSRHVSHIVIVCFTYHAVLDNLPEELRRHIVSLVDYTNSLLKFKRGNYLLLGTSGSYQLEIFEETENLFYPGKQDQLLIHECIYRLKSGEPKELVLFDIEEIVSKYDCSGVLIGCTDLYLISDSLENYFRNLDILNPLKVMTYDIVDSFKRTNFKPTI